MLSQTSVQRSHHLFMADMEKTLQAFGLTVPRFEVLVILLFSQQGHLPLGRIGKRLQVHPTSVTSLIDGLERQGNVIRTADPADRRKSLAALTSQGRDLVLRAKDEVTRNCYSDIGLSAEEMTSLVHLLAKVRRHLGDDLDETGTSMLLGEAAGSAEVPQR
ncbi:MAG: MarR family transcriptional regulator [Nocardioidaceae bacterium]